MSEGIGMLVFDDIITYFRVSHMSWDFTLSDTRVTNIHQCKEGIPKSRMLVVFFHIP